MSIVRPPVPRRPKPPKLVVLGRSLALLLGLVASFAVLGILASTALGGAVGGDQIQSTVVATPASGVAAEVTPSSAAAPSSSGAPLTSPGDGHDPSSAPDVAGSSSADPSSTVAEVPAAFDESGEGDGAGPSVPESFPAAELEGELAPGADAPSPTSEPPTGGGSGYFVDGSTDAHGDGADVSPSSTSDDGPSSDGDAAPTASGVVPTSTLPAPTTTTTTTVPAPTTTTTVPAPTATTTTPAPPATDAPTVVGYQDASAASTLVALFNGARSGEGVGALSTSPVLTAHAVDWAAHMASTGELAHSNWRPLVSGGGENVGVGFSSAQAVFEGWMGSAIHRSNILDASNVVVGVGAWIDDGGTRWFVAVFGG